MLIPTSVHHFVLKTKILRNSGFLWCGSRASTIVNRTGPGFRPHDALALFAKISDFERSDLDSGKSGELASAAEPDTTHPGIHYGTFIQHFRFLLVSLDC